ncbi:Mut7-C RNAse domain-containing protein [Georgenia sp. AZ-5]|uniref:Mut7-C RNAse domain-containing protein n=1 Tax=Georgenia sp. AZ-5 TaxID=3367526 RepID=UPI003755145F
MAGAAAPETSLVVDVAAELRFHLPPHRRRAVLAVPADERTTLGHLVQALGVPLTEVGSLVLDGAERPPSARAVGRRLGVGPLPRPQRAPHDPPRFVLDVHLGSLARRLRLLGLDAAYRSDAPDDDLASQALAEGRVLLTRDRELLRRRALSTEPRHGAFVRGTAVEEQMTDVLERFAPRIAPWTRCLACGGQLAAASKAAVAAQLMAGTLRTYDSFSRCSMCGRAFWRGAHSSGLEAAVARAEAILRRGPGGG